MADKDVTVKVVLHPAGDPDVFHFETTDLPMCPGNFLIFRNCLKGNHFRISYKLDNSARPGFLFPTGQGQQHLLDALWVHDSTSCPTRACTWDEFKAHKVKDEGLTLVVKNKNDDVTNFAYTLRVTNGSEWLELDPGGGNQNGGEPPFTSYASALVTGAIVGVGTAALTSAALAPSNALLFSLGGAVVGLIVSFVLDRF